MKFNVKWTEESGRTGLFSSGNGTRETESLIDAAAFAEEEMDVSICSSKQYSRKDISK
jgi:hypothetical protein